MTERIAEQLRQQTGRDVAAWRNVLARRKFPSERDLRDWLAGEGVNGYPQNLLVWEVFGYPDHLVASADALLDAQYADRPHLRPILDACLAILPDVGHVTVQLRKTFVSLMTPRRTFATVEPVARNRVELGLRLTGVKPTGRLQPARSMGNSSMTMRISLRSAQELDAEIIGWLRKAYIENS
jgi:hypothetical protein